MAVSLSQQASDAAPMLFLKAENRSVAGWLESFANGADMTASADTRLMDIDGSRWRLQVTGENVADISLHVPLFASIRSLGVMDDLRKQYGTALIDAVEGADVTVRLDRSATEHAQSVLHLLPTLRSAIATYPYRTALEEVAAGRGGAAAPVVLYPTTQEPVYLFPRPDRLTVCIRVEVEDGSDRSWARVVCQEMADPAQGRTLPNAPVVAFSEKEPPMELRNASGLPILPPGPATIGYLTITLFPQQHFAQERQRQACAMHLAHFRPYLHYHMTAAKSALHARMRSTVSSLQGVLGRAQEEAACVSASLGGGTAVDQGKKTATGRTFVRKV